MLGQFVALLLLVGFVGAYFWPIAVTIAAAVISYHVVLRGLTRDEE
jgi:multidrug efflux pump subunit AcrB